MVMGWFFSVVIDIIDVLRSVIKTKNHPPVSAYCNGPKAFHLALERMQPETRQIHMGNVGSGLKSRKNIPELIDMFRIYTARVVLFEKAFQPLMTDCLYHSVP